MNTRLTMATAAGMATLGIAGCATVPKNAGFKDVQHLVSHRIDEPVQWDRNTADDRSVHDRVNHMLKNDLTVNQAVAIALLNNRHLQATFEDLGISQAELVQAGLLKNPVFSGSWRFPDVAPRGTDSEYAVSEDFLDLLVLPLRKHVAAAAFESTKRSVAHAVIQLVMEVKSAYFTLQAREQLLGRLQLIADLNQTAADLAQRQHQAGTISELGTVSQKAIYDQSKVDVAMTEAQLATDREHLNRLLGLWGNQTQWKVSAHLPPIPSQEIPLKHLESLAIRQRLDLAATRAQLTAFAQLVGVTKLYRYFAAVDVGVDTEKSPDGQNITGPTVDLQIPIFDQGQARIAKADAQFHQYQQRYKAMAIDTRSEVRQARDRMMANRALTQYYKVLLPERMKILNLTMLQYNGMLKGPYDLLLAKQNEVNTEQAYIRAWRDYWIARADLQRAVGGRLPQAMSMMSNRFPENSKPNTNNQPMQGMKGMNP